LGAQGNSLIKNKNYRKLDQKLTKIFNVVCLKQLSSIEGRFCFCSNEMQQSRILRAKQMKGK
jgi:hypothetical protein